MLRDRMVAAGRHEPLSEHSFKGLRFPRWKPLKSAGVHKTRVRDCDGGYSTERRSLPA